MARPPSPRKSLWRAKPADGPTDAARVIEHPGSDYMVDVLKTLDIEYLAANPGSTYESLHESLINYGDNKMPEFLTAATKNRPSRWRTATPRSRASR